VCRNALLRCSWMQIVKPVEIVMKRVVFVKGVRFPNAVDVKRVTLLRKQHAERA
jgi:hypothetical protein